MAAAGAIRWTPTLTRYSPTCVPAEYRRAVPDGYACPGCGALLAVEVCAREDEPLRDLELASR